VLLVCAYTAQSSCVVSLLGYCIFVIIMVWAADECREDQMLWDTAHKVNTQKIGLWV
jgi:hypothetical protein